VAFDAGACDKGRFGQDVFYLAGGEVRRIKSNPALSRTLRCDPTLPQLQVSGGADAALNAAFATISVSDFNIPACKLLNRIPPVRSLKGRDPNQY
jgi:hypothetical protein